MEELIYCRGKNRREFFKHMAFIVMGVAGMGVGASKLAFGMPQKIEFQPKVLRSPRGGLAYTADRISRMSMCEKAFAETLNEALDTLNMHQSINKYGSSLNRKEREFLLSLDSSDLRALRELIQRIGS